MPKTKRTKINSDFVIERIEDQTVIFDDDNLVLFTLNKTASFIFNKLRQGLSKEEVVRLLANKYKISEIKAKNDVSQLIADMKSNKIIF